MRCAAVLFAALLSLTGCGSGPEPASSSPTSMSSTSSSSVPPTAAPSTELEVYTGLFDIEMANRGVVPDRGSAEEIRQLARDLCAAYDSGDDSQMLAQLVLDGWTSDQALTLDTGATATFCPQYFTG